MLLTVEIVGGKAEAPGRRGVQSQLFLSHRGRTRSVQPFPGVTVFPERIDECRNLNVKWKSSGARAFLCTEVITELVGSHTY